ncbi:MAG: dihydrofolate reductase [Clostridiales bacterium]|jgi:dihydrofolate reductase|nr:dihydrofolate reductase [Clostridiales bacterium]
MNLIACVDLKWGIGLNNKLLFDIKEDKAWFGQMTTGKTIVMGYNTWSSLPMHPLPNRTNIVLSSNHILSLQDNWYTNIEDLLSDIQQGKYGKSRDIFVIGGGVIYSLMLEYCHLAYITKVHSIKTADVYMPNLDEIDNWCLSDVRSSNTQGFCVEYCTYLNTNV